MGKGLESKALGNGPGPGEAGRVGFGWINRHVGQAQLDVGNEAGMRVRPRARARGADAVSPASQAAVIGGSRCDDVTVQSERWAPTQNVGADLEPPTFPLCQKDAEKPKPHPVHSHRFRKRAFPPPRKRGQAGPERGPRFTPTPFVWPEPASSPFSFCFKPLHASPAAADGPPRGHLGSGPRAWGFSGAINLKTQGSSPVSSAGVLWRALAFSSVGTGTPLSCANKGTEVIGSWWLLDLMR